MKSTCSLSLLESALNGQLPVESEAVLQAHLSECESCSAAMEKLAGGDLLCHQAAALLLDDKIDADVPSNEEWSDIDFTVEHLEPSDEPNVLGRLANYDILEIVGRGGMGIVLKAFDRDLKRCVAIKLLSPQLARSPLSRKRFAREAQAIAAVVHPNVLAIHQVQANGALPYLVMPLVAGESLAQRLAARGTLELNEVLRIGTQAAAGLAAAHEQGLVHRDVKPANILLEKGVDRAVLTDFGLARASDDMAITCWGAIAGTPQYMSPEQARGDVVDARSDLFSLGCVLYEMSTGISPFRADSTLATLRRLVDEQPKAMQSLNPELPPWFVGVVERLLEKEPDKRFASAKEVSELLEQCLAHIQQPASQPLPPGLPRPVVRRARSKFSWFRTGVIAMVSILFPMLLGAFLLSGDPPGISGTWTGKEWGIVELKLKQPGEYEGTYTDTFAAERGTIALKWSAVQRRFLGSWQEGADRQGKISIRLVDGEIRGAWTASEASLVQPSNPELSDLLWTKSEGRKTDRVGPVVEREIPYHHAIDFLSGRILEWPAEWRNLSHTGTVKEEERWIVDTGIAASAADGELIGHGTVATLTKLSFDTTTAEQIEAETAPLSLKEHGLMPTKTPYPITMSFKTREDAVGILQILGTTEGNKGVKIRYKLVHDSRIRATARGGLRAIEIESPKRDAKATQFPITSPVQSIACSAKAEIIAVGTYDAEKREVVVVLDGDKGSNLASLRVTSDQEATLLAGLKGLPRYSGHIPVAVSPQGTTIAMGSVNGQVKLFNAATGELTLTLDDQEGKLAETETPEELRSLPRALGSVNSLAFSPDGETLAVTGRSFQDYANTWGSERRPRLATNGSWRLTLWDVRTGKLKHDLAAHNDVKGVVFSPDGKQVASIGTWAEEEGKRRTGAILWNAASGEKLQTFAVESNAGAHSVAFSPDGKVLLIGSLHFSKDDQGRSVTFTAVRAGTGIVEWKRVIPAGASVHGSLRSQNCFVVIVNAEEIKLIDVDTGRDLEKSFTLPKAPDRRWVGIAVASQVEHVFIGWIHANGTGELLKWDLGSAPANGQ
jgi:serine/threonine protein kinase/WD40 repeat protein